MNFFSLFEKQEYRIVSDRIYLTPLLKKDLKIVKKWFEDNEMVSHAFGVLTEGSVLEKIAREYLKDIFKASDEILGIWLQDEMKLIGFVNYCLYSRLNNTSRIGIIIGEEAYRSLGYGTEAMLMTLYYLFEKKGLKQINLDTANFNVRAQNCFKSCGFKIIGEITEVNFLNGELIHKLEMSLTKDDFFSNINNQLPKLPVFEGKFPK